MSLNVSNIGLIKVPHNGSLKEISKIINSQNKIVWKRLFKVTFNAGEGSWSSGKTKIVPTYFEGTAIAPEDPVLDGYIFKGWDRSFTNIQSDITINAIWEEDTILYIITEDGRNVMTEDGNNLLIAEQKWENGIKLENEDMLHTEQSEYVEQE